MNRRNDMLSSDCRNYCEGLLLVLSGPSGTGKSTVVERLKKGNGNIINSVSVTTRQPRTGEREGIDYFFKTTEQFKKMIDNEELVEWDVYCNNYYGTPRKFIEDNTSEGFDIALDITVKGAVNIKTKYPKSVLIFILPPSFDELKKRIVGRGTENADVIDKRLETAKNELKYLEKYDYIVINDNIENAVHDINSIIEAEKLKFSRAGKLLDNIGMSF